MDRSEDICLMTRWLFDELSTRPSTAVRNPTNSLAGREDSVPKDWYARKGKVRFLATQWFRV